MTLFLQVSDNAKTRALADSLDNETPTITLNSIDTTRFVEVTNGYAVTIWNDAMYPDPGDDPDMEKALVVDAIIGINGSLTLNRPSPKAHSGTPKIALTVLAQHINDVTGAINALELVVVDKVDKVTGKELSENDYTDADKTRLADTSGTNTGDQDLSPYATNTALATKMDFPSVNQSIPIRTLAGGQSSLPYSQNATGNTLPYRTAGGQVRTGTPVLAEDATRKDYVDAADATKANFPATNNTIPARSGAGIQAEIPYGTAFNLANGIPLRDSAGQISVPTPASSGHATSKNYVDTADALKFDKAGGTITGGTLIQYLGDVNFGLQSTTPTTGKRYNLISAGAGNFGIQDVTGVKTPFRITTDAPNLALDITATGINVQGKGILYGTGFPNGVVSAPVGSIYIDTAVTNGAIEWIKASGTGNTGWIVSVGDTGWRNITSTVVNAWSAVQILVRRINNQVVYRFEGLNPASSTNAIFLGTISGFVPSGVATYVDRQFLTTAASPAAVWRVTMNASAFQLQGWTTSITLLYGRLDTITNDLWPVTLPGTAA